MSQAHTTSQISGEKNTTRAKMMIIATTIDRLRSFIQYDYSITFAGTSRRAASYFTSSVEVLFARAKQARLGNRGNTRVLNIKI
jgi:hypothetical protein